MDSCTEQPEPPPLPSGTNRPEPHLHTGAFASLFVYLLLISGLWAIQQIFLVQASTSYVRLSSPMATSIPLAFVLFIEAVDLIAIFCVTLFMAKLEGRPVGVFGLGGTHSPSRFFIGAAWGLIAISILIATLRSLHLLVFDDLLIHGPTILVWGLFQLFFFLLVGIFEEYCFRGYIQFTLTRALVFLGDRISPRHSRAIAFWIAALITSAFFLFAHTHNAGESNLGLFQVFLAGVVFVLALWRTGSLWWGIGFHMAWDWGQSFLYGVPDSGGLMQGRLFSTHALGNNLFSGGTVGPEGSILCAPIFLLVILVLLFTRPSPQPPLEID